MKILFLSTWFPYPPINGAKIRINNLIKQLAHQHQITLISLSQTIPIEEAITNIPHLLQYCQSVDVIPAKQYNPSSISAIRGFFSLKPRIIVQTYNPEMAELVDEKIQSEHYDVIVASEVNAPSVTSLIASRIHDVPKILDAIEIGHLKKTYNDKKALLHQFHNGMTWLKLKKFTRDLLETSQACTVPSLEEKRNLMEINTNHIDIEIIPHSLDLNHYSGSYENPQQNSLVFAGSFTHQANMDAAIFYLEKIYPLIKKELPEVKCQIVGNTNGVDLSSWPIDDHVLFTGLIKDVRPIISQSWLSIVPLRFGAGTRLKIIESMALGTPVVSTSKGAEGLEVTHGENILIADNPEEFAQSVLDILKNHRLREKLSIAGLSLVQDRYNSDVMGMKFNSLLDRVCSN